MLAADFAGQSYNKAAHNRDLQAQIDRNRSSIEFKHQNISAVLRALGEDWIPGYGGVAYVVEIAGRRPPGGVIVGRFRRRGQRF